MQDNNIKTGGSEANVSGREEKGMKGWHMPKPEVMPSPSYWPVVLAFGAALMGFGALTSYIISLVGLVLFILAMTKWIGEMCREK
jgi:hypothetical protein